MENLKLTILKNSMVIHHLNGNEEILFKKVLDSKVKRYFGKSYANRSKSWLTKIVDKILFLEESKNLPKEIKEKLNHYIADGWYYPKYDELRMF